MLHLDVIFCLSDNIFHEVLFLAVMYNEKDLEKKRRIFVSFVCLHSESNFTLIYLHKVRFYSSLCNMSGRNMTRKSRIQFTTCYITIRQRNAANRCLHHHPFFGNKCNVMALVQCTS